VSNRTLAGAAATMPGGSKASLLRHAVLIAAGVSGRQQQKGDPSCWGWGVLTYENCCLPQPVQHCWDGPFTAERCCGLNEHVAEPGVPHIIARLRDELFTDVDPYAYLNTVCGQVYRPQLRYPDSHLTPELIQSVLSFVKDVRLWVEVGSFIGSSAITTAKTLKELNLSTGLVCIDPFTGVVDMWSTRKAFRDATGIRSRQGAQVSDGPLLMDEFGHSRIYELFLANVMSQGHQDIVMPLRVSSITGMRLLREVYEQGRVEEVPQVIYLDSAHEPEETLLEVKEAWRLLDAPGVLFGDDWSWPGVRQDVTRFAESLGLRSLSPEELQRFDWPDKAAIQPVSGLAVVDHNDGAWMMLKEKPYL